MSASQFQAIAAADLAKFGTSQLTALNVAQLTTAQIAALQMQLGDRGLQQTLQQRSAGSLGFMPELLEAVVAGIPLAPVEQGDGRVEAEIRHQADLLTVAIRRRLRWRRRGAQRLAGFLEGSLRRRIDSGVTSSISSGPMYSRARSRVI